MYEREDRDYHDADTEKRGVRYEDIPEDPEELISFIAKMDRTVSDIQIQIDAYHHGDFQFRDEDWLVGASKAKSAYNRVAVAARRRLLRLEVKDEREKVSVKYENRIRTLETQMNEMRENRKRSHENQDRTHRALDAERRALMAFIKENAPDLVEAATEVGTAARVAELDKAPEAVTDTQA